jgi:hypothetical protein
MIAVPDQALPGRRAMTSWTIQPLPSGSLRRVSELAVGGFGPMSGLAVRQ